MYNARIYGVKGNVCIYGTHYLSVSGHVCRHVSHTPYM